MLEYNFKCVVCGRSFKSFCHNAKYCTIKCRNEILKRKRNPKRKFCSTCGKELADGRQTWCLECLLLDYQNTHSSISYKRLCNRGYDRIIIEEELKKRM